MDSTRICCVCKLVSVVSSVRSDAPKKQQQQQQQRQRQRRVLGAAQCQEVKAKRVRGNLPGNAWGVGRGGGGGGGGDCEPAWLFVWGWWGWWWLLPDCIACAAAGNTCVDRRRSPPCFGGSLWKNVPLACSVVVVSPFALHAIRPGREMRRTVFSTGVPADCRTTWCCTCGGYYRPYRCYRDFVHSGNI